MPWQTFHNLPLTLAQTPDVRPDTTVPGLPPGNGAPIEGADGSSNGLTGEGTGGEFGGGGGLGSMWMIFLLVLVVMWVFLIGGQRKEKKKRAALLAALAKGDKVQTVGGILGTVVEVRDTEVVLKVDENTNARMRFSRSAIQSILQEADTKDEK